MRMRPAIAMFVEKKNIRASVAAGLEKLVSQSTYLTLFFIIIS